MQESLRDWLTTYWHSYNSCVVQHVSVILMLLHPSYYSCSWRGKKEREAGGDDCLLTFIQWRLPRRVGQPRRWKKCSMLLTAGAICQYNEKGDLGMELG